jgi:hypothetical protein
MIYYAVHIYGNSLTDNNSNKTYQEFRALTGIHEHDFSSIRTEKEETSLFVQYVV